MDLNHHLYEEAGTPDAGKPKKQEEEERCMFCIELGKGVYFLSWVLCIGYAFDVLSLGFRTQTVEWKALSPVNNALDVITSLLGFTACAIGVHGIKKRDASRVYIYFCFMVVNVGLTLLLVLITSIEYGSGRLTKAFTRICRSHLEPGDEEGLKRCDTSAMDEAVGEIVSLPFMIIWNMYCAWAVRRLYLIILREGNGRTTTGHNYAPMYEHP